MDKKIKYAQVGLGARAGFFYEAILGKFSSTSELVGICDLNQTRMDYVNKIIKNKFFKNPVNKYKAENFRLMIEKEKPDVIIVTTIDRTHHKYIKIAMESGCNVITEKPMTIDEKKANVILDTIKKTNKSLRVTFNYRYSPHNSKIKELIMDNTIGKINSVHFEWLLDTSHGADYFRRWHRDKRNSGGLLVHKCTHHFDLVNFWLGTFPKTVFAMGNLMFYGRENAEENNFEYRYYRGSKNAKHIDDHFALNMENNDTLKRAASHYDGLMSILTGIAANKSIEKGLPIPFVR